MRTPKGVKTSRATPALLLRYWMRVPVAASRADESGWARFSRVPSSSPWQKSRGAAQPRFGSRARREEEIDAGHLRRRATKLSGQILAAQRVAAAPGGDFVAAPTRCPASLASLRLVLAPAALATRPTGLLPRAASGSLLRTLREHECRSFVFRHLPRLMSYYLPKWGNTHPANYSTGYAAGGAAFADFGIIWVGPFAVNSR